MKKTILLPILSLFIVISCNIRQVKTIENLKTGVKNETTSSLEYAAFSEKAKAEGHNEIAKLFEAISKSERVHATNHRKVLRNLGVKVEDFKPVFDVKTTIDNLEAAIDGETYETKTMYPLFLKEARAEKNDRANKSFSWAFESELKHLVLFEKAVSALENKTEKTLSSQYAVCPICGNTYEQTDLEDKCAYCGTPKEKFTKI